MPLLPLQTVVDYQLLYCGRQSARLSSPEASASTALPQELWPIGNASVASDGDDDPLDHRPETSIFHDELATSIHTGDADRQVNAATSSTRPVSMFEVPGDGRTTSTAIISPGDATKDERAAGGMSDEARTAMLDVAGYTTSTAVNDRPSSAGNRARLPPSSRSGVLPAKVATEQQAVRHLTSKAPTILETTSTASEGKGDARLQTNLQASTSLYPGPSVGSAKTLLDYYSARAAERRSDAPTRRQYTPPRVTMSFFPSRDKDANEFLTSSPTATYEPVVAERSPPHQQQHPARQMQSAPDALREQTTDTGHKRLPKAATTSEQNVPEASTTAKSDSTPTSIGPAVTTEAAATTTTEKATSDSSHQVLKAVNRKLSEPLRVASPTTNNESHPRGGGGGGGEAIPWSGIRRVQNISNGAATDVFLSSILTHLMPVPQTAEKDWGHFTLVKPANQNQPNFDSKSSINTKRSIAAHTILDQKK